MTPSQLEELNWDWEFWARPNQLIPKGYWLTWLLLAGRGFGKTRSAAEAVRALVCGATPLTAGKHARIALVAETAADARDVMVEGESGLLAVHPQEFRPLYEPSKRRLTWPNGALATLYNAVEPDQLRGPQHSLAWCDELAKWRYAQETWDMLQFGLRLGARPQAIIATTPRPIPVLKQIIRQPGTVITRGTTFENRSNLAESFLSQVVSRYEGTRLGRQELSAEILDDIPGALWTRAVIDGRERLANCRKCRELSLRSILQVRADQDALPRRTADEAKDPASIATLGEFCPRS
jgi:phage terminase large subunit-like protein